MLSQEQDVILWLRFHHICTFLSIIYPFLGASNAGRREVGLEGSGGGVRVCALEQLCLCASVSSSVRWGWYLPAADRVIGRI